MKFGNQGFALMFAVIVMAVAGALLTGLLFNSTISLQVNSNDLRSAYAKTLAETGLNKMQTAAYQSYSFYSEGNWQDYELTYEQTSQAICDNYLSIGLDLDRLRDSNQQDANNQYYRTVGTTNDVPVGVPVFTPVTLADGVKGGFETTLTIDGDRSIIQSRGYLGDNIDDAKAISTSLAAIKLETTASAWENAVFAEGIKEGNGQINGKVAIYGSVHLVGTPADGVTALALSGTAGVYRSYLGEGSNSDISTTMATVTGSNNLDICARIRIREGNLDVASGSSTAGTAANPLQSVELGGSVTGGGEVWTESNEIDPYDNNLQVVAPTLDSEYPSETDTNPHYFGKDESGNYITVNMIDLSACGQFTQTLQGKDTIVFANSSRGQNDATPFGATCSSTSGEAAIAWLGTDVDCNIGNALTPPTSTASDGYLCIAGHNPIANSKGADILFYDDVFYKGKGTIRAGANIGDTTANIEIDSDLLPHDSVFPAAIPDKGLEGSILSLVSSGDMDVGTSAQVEIAAVLFAQGDVILNFQTLVIGSIIANAIQASNQVPGIAYENRLIDNLPVGAPGAESLIRPYLRVEAYERR